MLIEAARKSQTSSSVSSDAGGVKPAGRSRSLTLILALAFILRILLVIAAWRNDHAALAKDSAGYIGPAISLAHDGTFNYLGAPDVTRTPGYPLFLVLCNLTGPLGYGVAQIIQVILDTVLVYLTYLLGSRFFGRRTALWAACLHAVSLVAIIGSVRILSDGLFSLFLTIAILFLVKHFDRGNLLPLSLAALTTAAATYIRPVGLSFFPVFLLVLLFRPRRLINSFAFAAIFIGLLIPWCVRNYLVAGYFGFTTVQQFNLLFEEASPVWAKYHNIPIEQARHQLEVEYNRQLTTRHIGPNSPKSVELETQMARSIISEHPIYFLYMHLLTATGTLLPEGTTLLQMLGITDGYRGTLFVLHNQGLLAAFRYYFGGRVMAVLLIVPEILIIGIQYLGCIVFAWSHARPLKLSWPPAAWLFVLTILSALLAPGPMSMARYRMPVDPLLCVGAGAGIMLMFRHRAARSKSPDASTHSVANQHQMI